MMSEIFKLDAEWGNIKNGGVIIPYGIGRIGRRVLSTLKQQFEIPFILDEKNNGTIIDGIEVFKIEDKLSYIKNGNKKIVVTTMVSSYEEILSKLESLGLRENVDYCLFERFVIEWNLRWNNKCVLSKIDTVITSRCTLKCKNCNMFISYIENKKDENYENLKRNFDTLFSSIDFVYEYTLLGGEPFLHRDISKILNYLCNEYGNKIGKINLISNGTVIPSHEVLEIMAYNNISVHISDYTGAVSYEKKIEEAQRKMNEYGIEYYVIPNNVWKDVMFPTREYTAQRPREHMRQCGHSTHSVNNGKLYWCDPAYAAECFMNHSIEEGDYLDLVENKENNDKYEAMTNIINYLLGDMNERGYMSICKKCAGVGKDNNNVVTAGIQC